MCVSPAESNAIDLFCRVKDRARTNCDHQTNSFEKAICAADCSIYVENRLIMETTSSDRIERSAVAREPTPSIMAMG
jgi:hypothetical protein